MNRVKKVPGIVPDVTLNKLLNRESVEIGNKETNKMKMVTMPKISTTVNTHTLSRAIRRDRFYNRVDKQKKRLNKCHKVGRLKWAHGRENGKEEWKRKVFIDETRINSSGGAGPQKRVWISDDANPEDDIYFEE